MSARRFARMLAEDGKDNIDSRLTLVLLELVKVRGLDAHGLSPPSVHLSGNGPPEDLVKHRVRHVVVSSSTLMLGYSEGMGVSPCSSPRHLTSVCTLVTCGLMNLQ